MTISKPLTDAQLRALHAAADQPDRFLPINELVPRPRGASRTTLCEILIGNGVVDEVSAPTPELAWRQDEHGQP